MFLHFYVFKLARNLISWWFLSPPEHLGSSRINLQPSPSGPLRDVRILQGLHSSASVSSLPLHSNPIPAHGGSRKPSLCESCRALFRCCDNRWYRRFDSSRVDGFRVTISSCGRDDDGNETAASVPDPAIKPKHSAFNLVQSPDTPRREIRQPFQETSKWYDCN